MKYQQHLREYRKSLLKPVTRRDALGKLGAGMGSIGLASMLGQGNLFGAALKRKSS